MRVTFCARDLVERCLLRLANRDLVQAQPQGAPRKWRESRYAADLQNSKPCRLRAPDLNPRPERTVVRCGNGDATDEVETQGPSRRTRARVRARGVTRIE